MHCPASVDRKLLQVCYKLHAKPFYSYKPDVKLRFLTEELGFESDDEAARFVCNYDGQYYLEERDDGVRLLSGKALNFFEAARMSASRKVGLKGQI